MQLSLWSKANPNIIQNIRVRICKDIYLQDWQKNFVLFQQFFSSFFIDVPSTASDVISVVVNWTGLSVHSFIPDPLPSVSGNKTLEVTEDELFPKWGLLVGPLLSSLCVVVEGSSKAGTVEGFRSEISLFTLPIISSKSTRKPSVSNSVRMSSCVFLSLWESRKRITFKKLKYVNDTSMFCIYVLIPKRGKSGMLS